jgi:hypothetical protein
MCLVALPERGDSGSPWQSAGIPEPGDPGYPAEETRQ